MTRLFTLAACLCVAVSGVPSFADARLSARKLSKADEALLRTVDQHYNHLASLRGRYTERYVGMGLTRQESGSLLLKKPGRMRWLYDSPVGKIFVLDAKYAWFYTPGDAQAQRVSARQIDDLRTPLRFLLGHTELKKELADISVVANGDGFDIVGIPNGMRARVKQLSLQVTPAGSIVAIKLEEIDGAVTAFSFSELQENVPAKDSDFLFSVPPGVAVVDGAPPV